MAAMLRSGLLVPACLLLVAPLFGQAKELTPQELESIWVGWIGNDDDGAARAREGMRRMIASPQAAVAFLKAKAKPAPAADAKKVEQALADLDSGTFAVRETAMKDLEALGVLAAAALERKLKDNLSLEVRRRIETLLQRLDDRTVTAEELRSVRTVAVLRAIGTSDARAILESLAQGGDGALLTVQARQALADLASKKK